MKKCFLLGAMLLLTISVWAARNYPRPVQVRQSDGARITVIGYGDEHDGWYQTTDGVLLVHEGTNFYVANIAADGSLSSTGILAHESALRNLTERRAVEMQNPALFHSAYKARMEKAARRKEAVSGTRLFPHTGTPKALVILVEFKDTLFSVDNPKQTFDRYLNADDLSQYSNLKKNHGSVARYYKDMSGGSFCPQFDVVGPVRMDTTLKYYGEGRNDRIDRLIPDACKAADDSVNFADYDADGDGYVDLVYIICAGYAESWTGNSSDCIWPKSGATSGGTYDGVTVSRYGIGNELNGYPGYYSSKPYKRVSGPGIFVHEFAHCLGLPDFYATNSTAIKCNNQAMEYWDLMDAGEYANGTNRPKSFTAWEREAMGWMTIDTLTKAATITLDAIENGGKAYKILNEEDANEYFILENVQKTGWDKSSMGHGLIVTHVLYNSNTFSLNSNTVNNVIGKPGMTVLPADSLLLTLDKVGTTDADGHLITSDDYRSNMAADPFPGTTGTTALTDTSWVKPQFYTGNYAPPITGIKENSDSTVTFKFMGGTPTYISELDNDATKPQDIYTISGMRLGNDATQLPKGIYIINKKKVVVRQ